MAIWRERVIHLVRLHDGCLSLQFDLWGARATTQLQTSPGMIVVRNNSRCGYFPVRRLQTRADSGMMIAWCSWRERSSE